MFPPSLSAIPETSTGAGRPGTWSIATIRSCTGGGSISDEARGFISLVPCLFHVDNHRDWCRHLFLCNNNSNERIATNPGSPAKDGAEKLSRRTAPYGRGSVCRCKRLVSILSRDHRERFSAFFSTGQGLALLPRAPRKVLQ